MWLKIRSTIWEVVKFMVVTLVIVIPIRTFVAQPFIVSGTSMVPTFHDSEYLIIDELTYYFRPPARGEVIVFRYPNDPSKHFIKRIINLPGETVKIAGEDVRLKADEYYVLGDNRSVSLDSRVWGPLGRKFITGRVLLRLLPPQAIAFLPGQNEKN